MAEIARPHPGLFATLDPEVDDHFQILHSQNLARARFVNVGFWLAVGQ